MSFFKHPERLQSTLLIVSSLILIVFVVLPLFALFGKAFFDVKGHFVGLDNFARYFSTPNLVHSLNNTLVVSSITAVVSTALGFLYAYALTRTHIQWKSVLRFTSMLPLFAPTMMLGIGLIYLIGNKGILTAMGLQLPLYGPLGIILSEIIYTFPQTVMIMVVSLSFADNRLYEAADVMGVGSFKQFVDITLPSVRYGAVSSFFVAFTLSFTDFGAPKVVGGNFSVLAKDIYKHVVANQDFTMGAVAGLLLMTPAIVSFLAERFLPNKYSGTINAKSIPYVVKQNPSRDVFFGVYCLLVNVFILGLIGTVVAASLIKVWPYDMSLSLSHYLFNSPATGGKGVFFNSILVSGLTAIMGTVYIFSNAYLVEKTRGAKVLRRFIAFVSLIPLALPGLAIGIAYIFFFADASNPLNMIYGTFWILVFSNIVHFYAVPFVTASSALKKLDPEYEFVAESMNVPFYRTCLDVTVPLSTGAILEIAMYFFINSMATISAVVFLYPADFKLAAIAIVNMEDAGDIAPAAALSVMVIVTNICARLVYEYVSCNNTRRV